MTAPLKRKNVSCQQAGNIESTYRSNTVVPSILQVPIILHLHKYFNKFINTLKKEREQKEPEENYPWLDPSNERKYMTDKKY